MALSSRINDDAWQKVADRTNLLTDIRRCGYSIISAKELEEHSDKRQPRLMCKFDFEHQRPKLFKNEKLNILPLKRGQYVVFRDEGNRCYFKLPSVYENRRPTPYTPKRDIREFDTLAQGIYSSEQDAIEIAFISSLLSTFSKTRELIRTKGGRFGSKAFDLRLPGSDIKLQVDGSQVEVDGIFESHDCVLLVEAKIGFHQTFHVRQLFYPYQWLRPKLQGQKKRIVPVLLCYSNGEYQITEFAIGETIDEIKLLRQEYFVIESHAYARSDIGVLARSTVVREQTDIPFPQADDMDKVIDILRLSQRGFVRHDQLVAVFGFVPRQAAYYQNATRYLGLVDNNGQLTATGKRLLSERYRINRTEQILKQMLARPALRELLLLLEQRAFDVTKIEIEEIESAIARYRPGEFTQETLNRRATTIRNWLRWVVANCDVHI